MRAAKARTFFDASRRVRQGGRDGVLVLGGDEVENFATVTTTSTRLLSKRRPLRAAGRRDGRRGDDASPLPLRIRRRLKPHSLPRDVEVDERVVVAADDAVEVEVAVPPARRVRHCDVEVDGAVVVAGDPAV